METSNSFFHLTGRTAIVTGAGRGVGAAIAARLAAAGARVLVNDIDADSAAAAVADIRAAGGDAHVAVADVTDATAVDALVAAETVAGRPIDILVHNAGLPREGLVLAPFEATDPAAWRPVVELNLFAAMTTTRAVVGSMKARRVRRGPHR